jgi:signal peptidase
VASVIVTTVVAGVVAAVTAAFGVPAVVGGQGLTVLSGSMMPTIAPGDVIATRPVDPARVCDEIALGHVVVFLPYSGDPTLVSHRVVGITNTGDGCLLTTQGDANNVSETVTPQQVRARKMYVVPLVGWAHQWASRNATLVTSALVVTVVAWIGGEPVGNLIVKHRTPSGVHAA